ncbi:MAG: glycosyltransferase family 9 protein [Deltaproteobacteria bacterium]|jgi:heptosyltransferase-2|nr:glycosyltransferase family 9 protein [Deltaproteobacteria bacterium]
MKRIAVWNTAFLGDAVLTLPLLQSLRLRYPDALIDYYVRGGLAPLFAAHPAISGVYSFDKRDLDKGAAGLIRVGSLLAARKYSLWLSPHVSARSAAAALASRAPLRIGYNRPLFNRLAYTSTVSRCFGEMGEIERILRLLLPLGPGPECNRPEIVLPAEALSRAEALFSPLDGKRPILGLHPGSVWASKRWPGGHFAALAACALAQGVQVLIFAGIGEEDLSRAIVEGVRAMRGRRQEPDLHDFTSRVSLPELAACLARLDCYLANDSGPMHIAWSLGTPVAAIFGPTVPAFGFTPRGERDCLLEAEVPCRPCGRHGHTRCPLGHHLCMTLVRPETVWEAVRKILGL